MVEVLPTREAIRRAKKTLKSKLTHNGTYKLPSHSTRSMEPGINFIAATTGPNTQDNIMGENSIRLSTDAQLSSQGLANHLSTRRMRPWRLARIGSPSSQ